MPDNGNMEITNDYGKKNYPSKGNSANTISIPFVLTLILVFAATIICTLLSGVMIYRNINGKIDDRYNETTPLMYISSKIRSHDYLDNGIHTVSVGEIDGNPALIFAEEYECVTYIYCYEGEMYELYMSAAAGLSADQGNAVLECPGLDFYMNDNIITVALTTKSGEIKKISVTLNSRDISEGVR